MDFRQRVDAVIGFLWSCIGVGLLLAAISVKIPLQQWVMSFETFAFLLLTAVFLLSLWRLSEQYGPKWVRRANPWLVCGILYCAGYVQDMVLRPATEGPEPPRWCIASLWALTLYAMVAGVHWLGRRCQQKSKKKHL